MIDVSIIIVNWNTCGITCDCLRSVYEQTKNVEFEIILVDNASSDDSVETIRKEFPEVVLIENSENRGFAAANNQGMEIARGRYILLLNSDTIVLDNAIEKTAAFADEHPGAGIVGCRVLNGDLSLQPNCFMYPSVLNMLLSGTFLYKIFSGSKFFGREGMTWWDFNEIRQVDVVRGCFMLVRRAAVEQVGVLDEDYFFYAEETDFCYRVKKAGWDILFTPDSEIIHLGGQSSKQIKPQRIMQLRAGILQFIKKHKSLFSYILACVLTSAFFCIRVPYWLVKSVVSDNRQQHLTVSITYMKASFKSLFGWKALSWKK